MARAAARSGPSTSWLENGRSESECFFIADSLPKKQRDGKLRGCFLKIPALALNDMFGRRFFKLFHTFFGNGRTDFVYVMAIAVQKTESNCQRM